MKSLLVEGWRGINQSYALVNENQLLCMTRYPIALLHRDMPIGGWNQTVNAAGFPKEAEKILHSIPSPPEGMTFDVTYRITHPYNYQPVKRGRAFVFGTSEGQNIKSQVMDDQLELGTSNPSLHIVTPSHWSAVAFREAGFDDSRIHVVPHGVNLDIFKPQSAEMRKQARINCGLAPEEFVILSLGSMTGNKGIDVLLLAFARLRQKYKHVVLMLKDQKGLYQHTAEAVLKGAIENHPQVFTEDVLRAIILSSENYDLKSIAGIYTAADCYVSPYRGEGFGLTPLEAAACGTPIVVTKGGATDIYTHPSFALPIDGELKSDQNWRRIEPNVESVVEQITRLVEGQASEINKERAIKYIQENFSWQNVTRQLMEAMDLA